MTFLIIIINFFALNIISSLIFNIKDNVFVKLLINVLISLFVSIVSTKTECRDGWVSSNIGIQGACSWHGGVVTRLNTFGKYEILFSCLIIGLYLLKKINHKR